MRKRFPLASRKKNCSGTRSGMAASVEMSPELLFPVCDLSVDVSVSGAERCVVGFDVLDRS